MVTSTVKVGEGGQHIAETSKVGCVECRYFSNYLLEFLPIHSNSKTFIIFFNLTFIYGSEGTQVGNCSKILTKGDRGVSQFLRTAVKERRVTDLKNTYYAYTTEN